MKIKFINVGRAKMTYTKDIKQDSKGALIYSEMVKAVKPYLMSKEIEIIKTKPNGGLVVVGGIRDVGEWEVEE